MRSEIVNLNTPVVIRKWLPMTIIQDSQGGIESAELIRTHIGQKLVRTVVKSLSSPVPRIKYETLEFAQKNWKQRMAEIVNQSLVARGLLDLNSEEELDTLINNLLDTYTVESNPADIVKSMAVNLEAGEA